MGMGGSDGCRNDILLIVVGYKSMYIHIYICTGGSESELLNRGTLGLQSRFQVYGNHYKKFYQFSIYFR